MLGSEPIIGYESIGSGAQSDVADEVPERLGVSRECAEMLVEVKDDDGEPNIWREWVRIVAGDPTQHAEEVHDREP